MMAAIVATITRSTNMMAKSESSPLRTYSNVVTTADGTDATIPEKNIQLITKDGQHKLRIFYDKDLPFVYNVDLLVHFDNTVDLSHGATY